MLYHFLYPLAKYFGIFNVFQYITFRTIYAAVTALVLSFLIGPYLIEKLRVLKFGEVVREDGPASHFSKAGTPTMGGAERIECRDTKEDRPATYLQAHERDRREDRTGARTYAQGLVQQHLRRLRSRQDR